MKLFCKILHACSCIATQYAYTYLMKLFCMEIGILTMMSQISVAHLNFRKLSLLLTYYTIYYTR